MLMRCICFLIIVLILTCLPVLTAIIAAFAMFKLTIPKRANAAATKLVSLVMDVMFKLAKAKLTIAKYYKIQRAALTHFLCIVAGLTCCVGRLIRDLVSELYLSANKLRNKLIALPFCQLIIRCLY